MQRECGAANRAAERGHAVEAERRDAVAEIGAQGGVYACAGRVVAGEYVAGLHAEHVGGERILLGTTYWQALAGRGGRFAAEGAHLPGRGGRPEREIGREHIPAAIQMEYIVRYLNHFALHAAGEPLSQPHSTR